MIAGQNQVVVGFVRLEVSLRLADRIRRPLKPRLALGRLLGSENVDETTRKQIHAIGLTHVPIQRRGVELRQDIDAADIGMEAIANRYVDKAVLAADRNCRLRSQLRQWKEP